MTNIKKRPLRFILIFFAVWPLAYRSAGQKSVGWKSVPAGRGYDERNAYCNKCNGRGSICNAVQDIR